MSHYFIRNSGIILLESTMVTMCSTGIYQGVKLAQTTCFKKELTTSEKIGECFCFSTIVLVNGLMYTIATPFLLASSPFLIPYISVNAIKY